MAVVAAMPAVHASESAEGEIDAILSVVVRALRDDIERLVTDQAETRRELVTFTSSRLRIADVEQYEILLSELIFLDRDAALQNSDTMLPVFMRLDQQNMFKVSGLTMLRTVMSRRDWAFDESVKMRVLWGYCLRLCKDAEWSHSVPWHGEPKGYIYIYT